LLEALAKFLQLDALQPDSDGLVAIAFGSELTVHLQADVDHHAFVLFGVAAALPPGLPQSHLLLLLQANRFWRETGGATLSLDDETPPRVILAERVSWLGTSPVEFQSLFEDFADYLRGWRARLLEMDGSPAVEPIHVTYA
jgi:hypothetical protein